MISNHYQVVSGERSWQGESADQAVRAFRSYPNAIITVSMWEDDYMVVSPIDITAILKATIRESYGKGE